MTTLDSPATTTDVIATQIVLTLETDFLCPRLRQHEKS